MGITIKVTTKETDQPGYADWMIVCYKIHNPSGFKRWDHVGVDLPGNTSFMPPERVRDLDWAPKYDLDGKGSGPAGIVTSDRQQDVEICFVAKKGPMRRGDLSLELNRPRIPEGSDPNNPQLEPGRWERLPYDGAPEGIRPHEVPPAIAMAGTDGDAEHVALVDGTLAAVAFRRVLVSMQTSEGPEPSQKPK